jgi:hypothetical protein
MEDCWGVVASHAGFLCAWMMTQVSKTRVAPATRALRDKCLALFANARALCPRPTPQWDDREKALKVKCYSPFPRVCRDFWRIRLCVAIELCEHYLRPEVARCFPALPQILQGQEKHCSIFKIRSLPEDDEAIVSPWLRSALPESEHHRFLLCSEISNIDIERLRPMQVVRSSNLGLLVSYHKHATVKGFDVDAYLLGDLLRYKDDLAPGFFDVAWDWLAHKSPGGHATLLFNSTPIPETSWRYCLDRRGSGTMVITFTMARAPSAETLCRVLLRDFAWQVDQVRTLLERLAWQERVACPYGVGDGDTAFLATCPCEKHHRRRLFATYGAHTKVNEKHLDMVLEQVWAAIQGNSCCLPPCSLYRLAF